MTTIEIVKAPLLAMKNWDNIQKSKDVGCYKCVKIIPKEEIRDKTDEGQTGLCPYCYCDTLVPDNVAPITEEYLKKVKSYWID